MAKARTAAMIARSRLRCISIREALHFLFLLVSILSFADSSLTARRDAALKAINACVQCNEVSSRECKKLNANVQTLVDVYKQGDKTVLPTLFKFTYLTDFYGDALLAARIYSSGLPVSHCSVMPPC